MIIDCKYNKWNQELSISHVTDSGAKKLIRHKVYSFQTYVRPDDDELVEYEDVITLNWDGTPALPIQTITPRKFDIWDYLRQLPVDILRALSGKTAPKMYAWDIEVDTGDENEFPDPAHAQYPITTISIVNWKLDCIVLGTRELPPNNIEQNIYNYIKDNQFYRSTGLSAPKFTYIKFDDERSMLKYFFVHIVSVVPVLAGWNSNLFDWQYIHNRVVKYHPDIKISLGSCTRSVSQRAFYDKYKEKKYLNVPDHTLLIDYMDIIDQFDHTLLFKESLSLDYIANEAVGLGKIKYTGDLHKLYEENYEKYVFYNCIDSILVQLIDKKLKTMANLYAQAQFCNIDISSCTSKIAITEAMFFNYFHSHGYAVIPGRKEKPSRSELVGAYVATPIPGKHNYVCCNDFASLYPSCIQTCNLSVENYIGSVRDGTFTEDELEPYRNNSQYVVTVNGSVYKNDKSYAFREIQAALRANRNRAKYLAKSLAAKVLSDTDHILAGRTPQANTKYSTQETTTLKSLGYDVRCTNDLLSIEDLSMFRSKLSDEIEWLVSFEQANKLVMNSMYGGSSHIAFFWYNIDLANDITSEGRNLIHKMEKHIPQYFSEHWEELAHQLQIPLKAGMQIPEQPVYSVYGDTDSIYLCYDPLLHTIAGEESMTPEQKRDIILKINLQFLNKHNKDYIADYYRTRHCQSVHDFELETINYSGIWLGVKKRYAQLLLWKDGKVFDPDERPLKVKGLETIKASYPKAARDNLKQTLTFMLNTTESGMPLVHKLNSLVQSQKVAWFAEPIDNISENKNINGYKKYVLREGRDGSPPVFVLGSPYHVKALANYNWGTSKYGTGESYYGGKMKVYVVKKSDKKDDDTYFAYPAGECPTWAENMFPVDKKECFKKYYLDALNRILEGIGMMTLNISGCLELNLFD